MSIYPDRHANVITYEALEQIATTLAKFKVNTLPGGTAEKDIDATVAVVTPLMEGIEEERLYWDEHQKKEDAKFAVELNKGLTQRHIEALCVFYAGTTPKSPTFESRSLSYLELCLGNTERWPDALPRMERGVDYSKFTRRRRGAARRRITALLRKGLIENMGFRSNRYRITERGVKWVEVFCGPNCGRDGRTLINAQDAEAERVKDRDRR